MNFSNETLMFAVERARMVDEQLRRRGIKDEQVLGAMLRVPRHEFVAEQYRSQSYEDHPLPIGEEQTISQPYIVALMLEALAIASADRVLEVGTGSGYVTALLAELAAQVFSVERHAVLAAGAARILKTIGYSNIEIVVGDGSLGLAAHAPYDVILVSAAAAKLPPALVEQLGEGGRMMIPVGPPEQQELKFVRRVNGEVHIKVHDACRFVPLVSDGNDGHR